MKNKLKFTRTAFLVVLGHALCDTTWFIIGRFTEVGSIWIIPNILFVSLLIAFLIERKH
jgi:hypothetical protein